jgi:hypothetical protein
MSKRVNIKAILANPNQRAKLIRQAADFICAVEGINQPEPCVVESDNIVPEDCICDAHALEAWLNEGSPRDRMRKASQER